MPDKIIKIHSREPKTPKENPSNFFKNKLVKTKNPAIIIERIVVAKVESIFCNPNFAKIATSAAVIADKKAYKIHIIISYIPLHPHSRLLGFY